jgi:hypothetical protein
MCLNYRQHCHASALPLPSCVLHAIPRLKCLSYEPELQRSTESFDPASRVYDVVLGKQSNVRALSYSRVCGPKNTLCRKHELYDLLFTVL